MNKTAMRIALESALKEAPVGKAQNYIRRATARNHGYQRPAPRRPRVTQVWSSPRAAKEFYGA